MHAKESAPPFQAWAYDEPDTTGERRIMVEIDPRILITAQPGFELKGELLQKARECEVLIVFQDPENPGSFHHVAGTLSNCKLKFNGPARQMNAQ